MASARASPVEQPPGATMAPDAHEVDPERASRLRVADAREPARASPVQQPPAATMAPVAHEDTPFQDDESALNEQACKSPRLRFLEGSQRWMVSGYTKDGQKINFQTTVRAANNCKLRALQIARLCIEKLKAGASKTDIVAYCKELYSKEMDQAALSHRARQSTTPDDQRQAGLSQWVRRGQEKHAGDPESDQIATSAPAVAGANNSRTTPEMESDIYAVSQVVSVADPISLSRIREPVRGRGCEHLQAFDKGAYIEFNQMMERGRWSRLGNRWKCPVCGHPAGVNWLVAADDFVGVLAAVKERPHVKHVEVGHDGRIIAFDPENVGAKNESACSDGGGLAAPLPVALVD